MNAIIVRCDTDEIKKYKLQMLGKRVLVASRCP